MESPARGVALPCVPSLSFLVSRTPRDLENVVPSMGCGGRPGVAIRCANGTSRIRAICRGRGAIVELSAQRRAFVMRDEDRMRGLGIRQVRTPFSSPRANTVAERWVRSARSQCLDHLIIFSEANLRRVLSAYVTYYNRWRPHRSLGQAAPCGELMPPRQHACRKIAVAPVLGGLRHIYRAAA